MKTSDRAKDTISPCKHTHIQMKILHTNSSNIPSYYSTPLISTVWVIWDINFTSICYPTL